LCFSLHLVHAQDLGEGKRIYMINCANCHGAAGKGDGPVAKTMPTKPADHTNGKLMNKETDKFLFDIISRGGAAVGKSPLMPAWGGHFNEKQVRDLLAYVRSLAVPPYAAPVNAGGKTSH
jgi:mono/diheme cytochrome c family protein